MRPLESIMKVHKGEFWKLKSRLFFNNETKYKRTEDTEEHMASTLFLLIDFL